MVFCVLPIRSASVSERWLGWFIRYRFLGDGTFLVLERDNQGGPDAVIKRLYKIDLTTVHTNQIIEKAFIMDLIPSLSETGGLIVGKVEGVAVTLDGRVFIVNHNDGVDDNSGETQLINLGHILP